MKNNLYHIEIIMISKFGREDGGRETWLYNFIPELLKTHLVKRINIFGYRRTNEINNSTLLRELDKSDLQRINPTILNSKINLPKFIMFFMSLFLIKKNKKTKPDTVIAVGSIIEFINVLSHRRYKKSIKIIWLRTIFTHEKAYRIPKFLLKFVKIIEQLILKKADIIIANGDDTKAYYQQYGLRINLLKNAIDPNVWEMPFPILNKQKTIKVAYIGRLSKVKGIEDFLNLSIKIKKSKFSKYFEFHIIGEANQYEKDVNILQNKNILKYHGKIINSDLPKIIKQYDICVALTYVSEKLGGAGLSNSLLEQMASGKIILAWDNNAYRQILNNDNAFLVEQYNLSDLEKSLIDIYENPVNAIKKANNAKLDAQPYTMKSHVHNFIDIIDYKNN